MADRSPAGRLSALHHALISGVLFPTAWRVLLLVILCAAALAGDLARPQAKFAIDGVNYAFPASAPFTIRTPLNLPESFTAKMDVLPYDTSSQRYIVEFLSATAPTLQIAVEPPHRLILVAFGIDAVPITLTENFSLRRRHQIQITVERRHLDILIDGTFRRFEDGALHQLQSSAQIGSTDFTYRAPLIQIGGSSAQYPFLGRISNLSVQAKYLTPPASPIVIGGALLLVLAGLWLLWPWLSSISAPELSSSDIAALLVFVLLSAGGILEGALNLQGGKWAVLLGPALGAMAAAGAAARIRAMPLSPRIRMLFVCTLTVLCAAPLTFLPNTLAAVRMFERWPLSSAVAVTVALCVAAIVLNASRRAGDVTVPRWAAWIPYAIFVLFALRTDSIFQPINSLHWDYFVGPVRAIREGGWLLWDVPSQYGFLNVLVAALVPAQTAVDAFYWFQSAAFFAASTLFYRTLRAAVGMNWIAATAVVLAFFYLADPLLIGPAAYPSMGAVRFFWCYVLLAMAANNFLGNDPSISRFARYGAFAWLAGVLWSAESAVYVSVAFFTPLLLDVLFGRRKGTPALTLFRVLLVRVAKPMGLAALAFTIIELCYLFALHHAADWSMFIAYVRSYGAGFGEMPIPVNGPIWILAWVLFGGTIVFANLRRRGVEAPAYATATALAVVWIVSSYYVGRAFPIVLTTLTPLYVYAIVVIIAASRRASGRPLLAVLATPLLALGLLSSFWNANAPIVAPAILRPNIVAWTKLPQADSQLASLLRAARISPKTPVVYYDSWVGMPRAFDGPYERNWLPTPLQDLDQPIPAPVRDKIITRFVRRHRLAGYFVEGVGGYNSPGNEKSWETLLSRFYVRSLVVSGSHYRVLRFSLRTTDNGGSE